MGLVGTIGIVIVFDGFLLMTNWMVADCLFIFLLDNRLFGAIKLFWNCDVSIIGIVFLLISVWVLSILCSTLLFWSNMSFIFVLGLMREPNSLRIFCGEMLLFVYGVCLSGTLVKLVDVVLLVVII